MASTFLFPIYIIIFLFGLAVGSFLNSVIYRLATEEGLLISRSKPGFKHRKPGFMREFARSYCPQCKHELNWPDLIPLLSFFLLRGKCRYCQQPISLQYPLVELATGIIFVALFYLQLQISGSRFWLLASTPNLVWGLSWPAVAFWLWHLFYWFFLAGSLIVIFVYDLKRFIIPDKIIYPAIGVAFLNRLFEALSPQYWTQFGVNGLEFRMWGLEFVWNLDFGIWNFSRLLSPLLVGILASVFFAAIVFGSKGRWMGLGDVKLAFLMGLFLGFPNIVTALFLAFLLGAVVGVILVLAKKKNMKSEVPFGPFLATGTFVALFWGQWIVDWYWNLFL